MLGHWKQLSCGSLIAQNLSYGSRLSKGFLNLQHRAFLVPPCCWSSCCPPPPGAGEGRGGALAPVKRLESYWNFLPTLPLPGCVASPMTQPFWASISFPGCKRGWTKVFKSLPILMLHNSLYMYDDLSNEMPSLLEQGGGPFMIHFN